MTAKQLFESALIETNKINAPALKLVEFNYLINKSIRQWTNKCYNFYDINQQTTDDLRVLKSEATLTPSIVNNSSIYNAAKKEVIFPEDYLHLLNCICIFKLKKNKDCWDQGDVIAIPATRLTADSWSKIIEDVYNRPTPLKPYYYIHNQNKQTELPTNLFDNDSGTDQIQNTHHEFPNKINLKVLQKTVQEDLIEKPANSRHSNASRVRCELRYGNDENVFELVEVHIDYIKSPQFIRLTQSQIDTIEDTSQILEFPDYIIQEIINELVYLIMERSNDPRLPNNIQITQTIARPTQQQQQ